MEFYFKFFYVQNLEQVSEQWSSMTCVSSCLQIALLNPCTDFPWWLIDCGRELAVEINPFLPKLLLSWYQLWDIAITDTTMLFWEELSRCLQFFFFYWKSYWVIRDYWAVLWELWEEDAERDVDGGDLSCQVSEGSKDYQSHLYDILS